jgi:hypothetical protein
MDYNKKVARAVVRIFFFLRKETITLNSECLTGIEALDDTIGHAIVSGDETNNSAAERNCVTIASRDTGRDSVRPQFSQKTAVLSGLIIPCEPSRPPEECICSNWIAPGISTTNDWSKERADH